MRADFLRPLVIAAGLAGLIPAGVQAQSLPGGGLPPNLAAAAASIANRAGGGTAGAAGTALAAPPGDPGTNRLGSTTEAEAGAMAALPLGEVSRASGRPTAVFGASLFTQSAAASSEAPNPNYVLTPGDRVAVRVWGAVDADQSGMIDPAGNFFLPNVGPIPLAGTRSGDIQSRVEQEVRRLYTQQVQVYATVLSAQRIGVFVTGFVRTPGRFAGSAADSVIDFLVRAGGVDPSRGSFREISILRGGRQAASVDLYRFLLDGRLPALRLQEGDTIVVGRQRALVGATGGVRNNFLFEVPGQIMTGRELIEYARPLPSATNAIIQGTRDGRPFSRYSTLSEFHSQRLGDQDVVTFITDRPMQTVRVTVEGSRVGPSVLVMDRDAQLCNALDYIEVDPTLADTSSIYILRASVAAQQARALAEASDRLERALFLATSPTQGVAAIRSAEAQQISSYLQRARRVVPEGRIVVFSGGRCNSIRLEDNDIIVIPERRETVLVTGEVGATRAVLWRPGITVADLIREAGGLTARGNMNSIMIRRASGEVILDPREAPRAGDEVIALPRIDPRNLQVAQDIMQVLFQAALAARVFVPVN
ncbi:polysaccharide biosynthesis/export family protein [Sediminicoccus rosea]|jgi:protein involved in polysaccharide export with SLBB domain|uniref:Polysaccharide biosynthesis/export family protein n=1 Tax=Sediminicoccus rosea TaxID=1225128 RepID=A0ABZ0PH35_9PROT|nr:polysaccharide biosynthesis/export family protein [Sediminicoccus rosea]WPB85049.1 polysaccharide biosynthesis/export family protein [Sediminicoccus rosea]